ncbi:MAG: threonine/homoserine/homoserine lactone efflux protein [Desulforhopalus sp.]|jgi:threonine/homoserine/homoserine lactone efflux protein
MEFVLVASAHFLALLSPGPDFFLVMQAAFRLPARYCISLCAGIAAANGVYLAVAITGLELTREMGSLMILVKYLGGAYLLFVGIMLLRGPKRNIEETRSGNYLHRKSYLKQFVFGFLSGILNPKNAIFYLAIFSVMVSAETSLVTRGLYGCWMTFVVFIWDSFVVFVLSRNGVKDRLGGVLYYIEKLSGVVLAFFGLFLTLS